MCTIFSIAARPCPTTRLLSRLLALGDPSDSLALSFQKPPHSLARHVGPVLPVHSTPSLSLDLEHWDLVNLCSVRIHLYGSFFLAYVSYMDSADLSFTCWHPILFVIFGTCILSR